MSLARPLISVVVPVYNTGALTNRCLDSICAQTYDNLDVVVVDDGSTDGSGEVCDAWARRDSRIRVYHTENRGVSAARNMSMDRIEGDYVAYVDSDDYIGMRHIENLYTTLAKTGADMVSTGISEASATEERRFGLKRVPSEIRMMTPSELVAEILGPTLLNAVCVYGRLYSKLQFPLLRFPEGRVYEDLVTPIRAINAARTVAYQNASDYFYTKDRMDSITKNPANLLDWLHEVEVLRDYGAKHFPELRSLLESRYYGSLVNVCLSFIYMEPDSQESYDLYARVGREADDALKAGLPSDIKEKYEARKRGLGSFRLLAYSEVERVRKESPGRMPM